jgi:hypothetical protein
MSKYKYLLLLSALLLLSLSKTIGQVLNNTVYMTGTFAGEGIMIYERYLGQQNSFAIGYGLKQGNKAESSLSLQDDQAQFYGGRIFQVEYRRYLNSRYAKKHQWYVSPVFMYKKYSFDHVAINHIGSSTQTCQIRSSQKEVYAAKVLVGRKYYLEMSPQISFIIDVFLGIGLRNRMFNDTIFEKGRSYPDQLCNCSPLAIPLRDNSSDMPFSFHTGILIGIAF